MRLQLLPRPQPSLSVWTSRLADASCSTISSPRGRLRTRISRCGEATFALESQTERYCARHCLSNGTNFKSIRRSRVRSPSKLTEADCRRLLQPYRCDRRHREAGQLTCFVRFISVGNLRNQDESSSNSSIS